jgi:hypothetical protein
MPLFTTKMILINSNWQSQGPFDPETLFRPPDRIYTPLRHLSFIKNLLEAKIESHPILGELVQRVQSDHQILLSKKTLSKESSTFWGLNWSSIPYYPTNFPPEDYNQFANTPWQRTYRNLVSKTTLSPVSQEEVTNDE